MRASEFVTEHKLVWTRKKTSTRGGEPVMKWRCTSGNRKGRVVSSVGQCGSAPDIAAKERMKKTRAKTEKPAARRAARTKKINTASRLIGRLNKYR
jgi:hypothetical protein|tara:strand:- start:831 stop:1118 length:288 start_codon:yes stop_codon:yes gene_type:complete